MLRRYLFLALVPAWVWLLIAIVVAFLGISMVVVLIAGTTTSSLATDFSYQCDSAVGPDPSSTVQEQPLPERAVARETAALGPSTAPTTNPYAALEIEQGDANVTDWQRSCVSAMSEAPYQLPSLLDPNTGSAAECARELALREAISGANTDSATMVRSVIYRASNASVTGRCAQSAGTGVDAGAETAAGLAPETGRESCGQVAGSSVVVLPSTVAAQGVCGQRVAISAVSPGDLIFWDYRAHRPTRVGIAVGGSAMVTGDPATATMTEQAIPADPDVRVKRVLGGAT
ncbi:hypothetical protein [Nocardia callitridis]|uniref:Uncharacterized protein n=1 Tax=Nocardia callitridis TaxID=648753 RepID=A0ABP9KNA8_9NOCA